MSKRYLRRLRAEMADVENLVVAVDPADPARGRFGYRCWPEGGDTIRQAFLAGLGRAEQKADMPVYGILVPQDDDRHAGDSSLDAPELETVTVWRARDGMFLGEGPMESGLGVILADVEVAPPAP